jgi:hypothetical protein
MLMPNHAKRLFPKRLELMRRLGLSLVAVCMTAALSVAGEPTPDKPNSVAQAAAAAQRPAMRDFMGLNVHTVQFKPDLYKPVCRLLRDYHPLEWDVGDDTSRPTTFPLAVNRVDWSQLYGQWTKAGYEVDACVMFDKLKPDHWKNTASDARAYGEAAARYFGRSGDHPWISSVEIGNEPSDYSDRQYRTVFEGMARGLRAGDPKLKIVTCAMAAGKADQWSKPMSAIDGLGDLYDVLNIHSYPFKDAWPTWRRSYPEDSRIPFLKSIQELMAWRDAHARGKQVWLTEFGYDSASKPRAKTGPWSQWVGVSDAEQARYIVRSFLVLSDMDIDRAYLYFFNDQDEPQLHGASGITRNFKPKPSFYAMAFLYHTLGDYHFVRAVVKTPDDLFCFKYRKAASPERIYVAWSPTGSGRSVRKTIPLEPSAAVYRAEQLATSPGSAGRVEWKAVPTGVELEVTETPVFLWTRPAPNLP